MNKFKINSSKTKLVLNNLNNFKHRSSLNKEDIEDDIQTLPFTINSHTLVQPSYDPPRKLSRIINIDSKENTASTDFILPNYSKDARKRERTPSRFHDKVRIQRTQSQIVKRSFCLLSGSRQSKVEELVQGLVELLRREGCLEVGGESFIIKKENFSELLDYLVLTASAKHRGDSQLAHATHPALRFLTAWMDNLNEYLLAAMRKDAVRQLQLHSNQTLVSYHPDEYHFDIWSKKYELQQLGESLAALKKELAEAAAQQVRVLRDLETKGKEVKILQVQKVSLQAKLQVLKQREVGMSSQVQRIGLELQLRREQKRKMADFIEEECSKKIIHCLSLDFKQIESDIYEYAVYLQSNQLASQIDYQPHPYNQIEQLIHQQMRNLNKCLIQDADKSTEIKNRLMRDFVLSTMDKFKKKDAQMGKLNEFKTKCIRQFVSHMKRWLSNWSLKQEHLNNLREQFVVDAKQVRDQLLRLGDSSLVGQISKAFVRIEENYKLGNSFY